MVQFSYHDASTIGKSLWWSTQVMITAPWRSYNEDNVLAILQLLSVPKAELKPRKSTRRQLCLALLLAGWVFGFQLDSLEKKWPARRGKPCSVLEKASRFAKQLKEINQEFTLPKGCNWADIYLQVDRAPPHCKRNKRLLPQIIKAAGRNVVGGIYYGPKVRLVFQPPNSPDLNVLDLGFFEKLWTKLDKI